MGMAGAIAAAHGVSGFGCQYLPARMPQLGQQAGRPEYAVGFTDGGYPRALCRYITLHVYTRRPAKLAIASCDHRRRYVGPVSTSGTVCCVCACMCV